MDSVFETQVEFNMFQDVLVYPMAGSGEGGGERVETLKQAQAVTDRKGTISSLFSVQILCVE